MRSVMWSVAALGLAGVLAGCGGGSSSASSSSATTTTAAAEAEVTNTWNVDATKDARWTATLKQIQAKLTSVQTADAEKAATVRTTQMIRLEKVLTQMAKTGGVEGLGHVACEVMPLQLLAYSADDSADIVAMQLGGYWTAPVVAAAGTSDTTYADVRLDARVQQECPDDYQSVLQATGLTSLNDLYFAADTLK